MRKKITISMVSVFAATLLVLTTATILSLASVQGQQGAQSFTATLAGSANKSNSTGTSKFQVDENNSKISYWLNVTGIKKINQAHIHNGTSGQSGDIIVSLLTKSKSAKGKTSPPEIGFSGNITKGGLLGPLKGKEISDLVNFMSNGSTYVNIHTDKYPKGAIRGQITTTSASTEVGTGTNATTTSASTEVGTGTNATNATNATIDCKGTTADTNAC